MFRRSASPPWCTLAPPAQALAGLGILAAASQSEVVKSSAGTISSEGRPASGVKGEAGSAGLSPGAEAAVAAGDPRDRARSIVVRVRPAAAGGFINPNFFIFEASVVGFRPSNTAAPCSP